MVRWMEELLFLYSSQDNRFSLTVVSGPGWRRRCIILLGEEIERINQSNKSNLSNISIERLKQYYQNDRERKERRGEERTLSTYTCTGRRCGTIKSLQLLQISICWRRRRRRRGGRRRRWWYFRRTSHTIIR